MLETYNISDKENRLSILAIGLVFLCVVWTCFEAPLSFVLDKELKEHNLWWDAFFSLVFALDIYFKIKKKYKLPTLENKNNARPYAKSAWFYVDVLTSLPYDIIASLFGLHIVTQTIVAIRFLRVLRIVKFRSIIQISNFLPRSIKIILTLTAIAIAIHVIACGWMLINPKPNLDIVTFYNTSLYWAVSTLTTVGYGDITPESNLGRAFTMMVMIIGAASYGIIIGNFSKMIMLADKYKEEKKEKLNSLNQFMKYYNIPKGLQSQTIKFYNHLLTQNISKEEEMIVKDLPQALQNELNIYKRIKLLRSVHIFKDCSTPCLKMIANKLEQTFHSPNEYILKKGDLGDEMFIIGHGEFEVSSGEKIFAVLKDGQFFGEMALLEDTIRSMDVISKSYCDLYSFKKEDFDEVTSKYPDLEERFKSKYKRRQDDKPLKVA